MEPHTRSSRRRILDDPRIIPRIPQLTTVAQVQAFPFQGPTLAQWVLLHPSILLHTLHRQTLSSRISSSGVLILPSFTKVLFRATPRDMDHNGITNQRRLVMSQRNRLTALHLSIWVLRLTLPGRIILTAPEVGRILGFPSVDNLSVLAAFG